MKACSASRPALWLLPAIALSICVAMLHEATHLVSMLLQEQLEGLQRLGAGLVAAARHGAEHLRCLLWPGLPACRHLHQASILD